MKYCNDYGKNKKKIKQTWREQRAGGFRCSHCKKWVVINDHMGTKNRNHCTLCLWSKHVDENKGDRRSSCRGSMKPVGLTFKYEGKMKQGEILLIHECVACKEISINRIAGDDDDAMILSVFDVSSLNQKLKTKLKKHGIELLFTQDRSEVMTQLFGK